MGRVQVYAGICGFTTDILAESADRQHVELHISSDCPDVTRIAKKFRDQVFDAYKDIGPCVQPGSIYDTRIMKICGGLPHVACPVPAGICKAVEVAAGLALPRDAHIRVSAAAPPGEDTAPGKGA